MDKGPAYAFFGTPYVARDTLEYLVAQGYSPSVVVTSPDAPRGRGMQLMPCETKVWALEHSIPVLTPATLDDAFVSELSAYACTYALVVAYGKIIPQAMIDAFSLGILNVHYSLLPAYRGASPVESALLNADTETGVSIQQMAFKLDAGDVLAQETLSIDPADTTRTLRPKLIALGSELLVRTLPAFLDGSATRTPQEDARATRAPKFSKEQGLLSLFADPYQNWLTYRALDESPGTYFFARKAEKQIRVKITDAAYENGAFLVRRIIPEGKGEQDFSYLSQAGWSAL